MHSYHIRWNVFVAVHRFVIVHPVHLLGITKKEWFLATYIYRTLNKLDRVIEINLLIYHDMYVWYVCPHPWKNVRSRFCLARHISSFAWQSKPQIVNNAHKDLFVPLYQRCLTRWANQFLETDLEKFACKILLIIINSY